jgi:FkbH-like protein
MKTFVFRNQTIEPLFGKFPNVDFSGYNDIRKPKSEYDLYIFSFFLTPLADEKTTIEEIEDIKMKISILRNELPKGNFIYFTLDGRYLPIWTLSNNNITANILQFNQNLFEIAQANNRIKVLEISRFFDMFNCDFIVDKKYYYMSKIIINPALCQNFVDWFQRTLNAIDGKRKKCIVVDLDNTLWGGILGEDGLSGIKIGNTYPGNCFLDFQNHLKEATKNGIILAICSKNNEDEVWAAFENHPDMILQKEDFVSHKINWNNKASNIRAIAEELNIGIDSIVFIDDNPNERELVKQLEPDVIIPPFPNQPYNLTSFFLDVYYKYFLSYNLTSEDKNKNEQYRINTLRSENRKSVSSMEEYLRSLKTIVSIEIANSFTIPRIAQLTQKTNQFNLTTYRCSENEISKILDAGNLVFCATVSDKFGDSGITVAGIINIHNETEADIFNYLLSCRILGREVENEVLKTLLNYLLKKGIRKIWATYIPTIKNTQVEDFYDRFGFTVVDSLNKEKRYCIYLEQEYILNESIKITFNP